MSKTIALVLGGGGARAAYQIGVLKALIKLYPRNHGVPFKILSGTSAGAINATSLATHASCFHLGVRKLDWVWSHMQTKKIYHTSLPKVVGHLSKMLFRNLQEDKVNTDAASLFDNEPLRDLLSKLIDLPRIDRNIHHGALTAVNIDTSCYNSASSVSFFQTDMQDRDWQRARRFGCKTQLHIEHLLASTAIPMVFPSVKINRKYYGDGSVHQFAPLSAPIHLGADKIMVINLDSPHQMNEKQGDHHPKTANIAGHLLDTIFSDTLNSDLERLKRINDTVTKLPQNITAELNLRHIETLVIKPSQDLSSIASNYYKEMPFSIRCLLKLIGINKESDSSILSYLLFESGFTHALIKLGYQDAMLKMSEIKNFFDIN